MKKMKMTLHVSEIEYDVQNRTYVDGKYRQASGDVERGEEIIINDEEDNAHFVRRCVQDAIGNLFSVVSEYVELEDPELTDVMMDDGAVEFTAVVPDQFPDSAATAAVSAMHEYISNAAMAQWYESTDTTKQRARESAAANKLQAVRSAFNRRLQYARCMKGGVQE